MPTSREKHFRKLFNLPDYTIQPAKNCGFALQYLNVVIGLEGESKGKPFWQKGETYERYWHSLPRGADEYHRD